MAHATGTVSLSKKESNHVSEPDPVNLLRTYEVARLLQAAPADAVKVLRIYPHSPRMH